MTIDPNSMPTGYAGYAAPQAPRPDPTAGLPKATTPMGGAANMVAALMNGYRNNKYVGGPQGNAPLQNVDGMGVPTDNTSQAAMGGGYGGGVFPAVQGDPGPVQDPYSNQTVSGLFGGGIGNNPLSW